MPNYIFDKSGGVYDLPPSLADSKSFNLSAKLAEKKERLTPSPVQVIPSPAEVAAAELRISGGGGSDAGLINMMESSVYQGAGSIADTYANIRQNLFGEEDFSLSEGVDQLSDEAYADIKAGFTGREAYQQDIAELTEAVGKEDKSFKDYLGIAGQGLALGPRALADSAASGLELGAGALAAAGVTALAGPVAGAVTGGAIFGRKAKKVAETVEKVVSFSDRLKKGAKAVPGMVAKSAGRTSLLTADITEQMRQDYKAQHGEDAEPSAAWYATNVPITMALNAVEFGLISKAVPKLSKSFVSDMKESVKFMSKSHTAEAAKRIFRATGKVASAASAEAGQEYLQTWHEILAPVVDGDTLGEMVTSAANELGKDKNQTEAIVGAILGFSAGGTARAVAAAPGTVAGIAVDVAGATAKAGVKAVETSAKLAQKAATAAGLKALSQEDRDVISNDYQAKQAVVDEAHADMDESIAIVETAETLKDIQDHEGAKVALKKVQEDMSLSDDDLADPKKLKSIKSKVISKFNADKQLLQTQLDLSAVGAAGKQIAKNVKKGAETVVEAAADLVTDEMVRKTVVALVTTKEGVDTALRAVKGLESSTARGLVDLALKEGVDASKDILDKAKNISMSDLDAAATVVGLKDVKMGKRLRVLYKRRLKMRKRTGIATDDVINAETIPSGITAAAESGKIEGQTHHDLSAAIRQAIGGKIADKATLSQVKKALATYKASEAYTNKGTKGRIDETNMKVFEKKLAKVEKFLNIAPTKENAEAAVETVKDTVKYTAKAVKEKSAEPIKKATAAASRAGKVLSKLVDGSRTMAEGKLKKLVADVEVNVISNTEYAEDLADNVNSIVNQLTKAGYATTQDFADFIKEFPGFAKNIKLYTALSESFDEAMIVMQKDVSEDVNEKTSPTENDATIVASTKKLLGC